MPTSIIRPKTDRWLALTVFALVLFGVVMIYSASVILGHTFYGDDKFFVKRQVISAIIGLSGMVVMAYVPYDFWRKWAGWMLGVTFILLISVFFFSKGEINGAHRWISLGGQTFQPSELAKLTFIIYASAWLVERREEVGSITRTFLPYLAVLFLVSILMLKEPDFGTLTIILAAAIAVYYVAGLTWQQIGLGVGVAVLGAIIALSGPSGQYRRNRVTTFLNPSQSVSCDKKTDYHICNISIAIGSGGAWGLGFGNSKQKRLFLPEPHTDSIFAIISEELGAVRSMMIIAVFCFLFYRGFSIAAHAPDLFGRLMASGITTWFGFQTFINLGSMLHIVPLVGVPLPFVSYGGTNLIISLLAVGILLNISSQAVPLEEKSKQNKQRRHAR